MKTKELAFDADTMKVEVEVTRKPKLILICDGKAKVIDELPDYGEVKVTTHQGKIKHLRLEQGETF